MRKQIGVVGVDSGQLVICDPCYIDSEWNKEEFDILRRYKHKDGTVLQYLKDFPHYEAVIEKYGKTMNQLNADGDTTEMPDDVEPLYPFSYNACCKKTCGPDGMGQLNYKMGHPGVGVVVGSFGGDGTFPVFANMDKDGMVTSITIQFY